MRKNNNNRFSDDNFMLNNPNNKKGRKNIFLVFSIFFLMLVSIYFMSDLNQNRYIYYSDFLSLLENNNIKWKIVEIENQNISAKFYINPKLSENEALFYESKYSQYLDQKENNPNKKNYKIITYSPTRIDSFFINELYQKGIPFNSKPPSNNFLSDLLISVIPWIIIFGLFWFFMFRQIQVGSNKALSFSRSKARLISNSKNNITFNDVAGVDEAKQDLMETVDFLKNPEKFKRLGAKIPKGVLLIGPPGTGKTLLARAASGEANCSFFNISGSEFVEMFVGIGASRVRDLFAQGKKHAPCIIFIDELDAVGRIRGSGYGGGHDEREQTLNQMLVEMDGFEVTDTVIVIAATNRPDILDPALLRPGRFDRKIYVDIPTLTGRKDILNIHLKKILYDNSVDIEIIAKGTSGFSGANLANLVNEASILAARYNKEKVTMEDFEQAKDKILMGAERKSMILTENEKRNTAYHEAGHTLLAYLFPKTNKLHKVSIIPRGKALGVTQTLPLEDQYTMSKKQIYQQVIILLGGRIAEEYKFGKQMITTGSSNDIQKASDLIRSMISKWGMHEVLGPISFSSNQNNPYFKEKDYSEKTAEKIDYAVNKTISKCYNYASKLIHKNIHILEKIAKQLLIKETLSHMEIHKIFKEKKKIKV